MKKSNTALLIIDIQFGPLWGTYKKEDVLSNIHHLIAKAEKEDVPIIYTQHEDLPGGMLIKGSQFWEFESGISPRSQDLVINKQSTDVFYHTDLNRELTSRGVSHLVIAGARTEYCIATTCRAALSLGYNVTLIEDAHTTIDGIIPAEIIIKHHNHHLRTVKTTETSIKLVPTIKVIYY